MLTDQNRSFGFVMAGMFAALAAIRYVWGGTLTVWLVAAAAVFFMAALAVPAWLDPVRRLWMRFAHVLGAVNSRILLTVVFGLIVTPIALVLRWLGRRPMALTPDRGTASYWRTRRPEEFTAARLERQF